MCRYELFYDHFWMVGPQESDEKGRSGISPAFGQIGDDHFRATAEGYPETDLSQQL